MPAKRKPPVIGIEPKVKTLINSKGKRVRHTKNFADVIRGKMADDPELATRVEEAGREADAEVAEYERRMLTNGPLADGVIDEEDDDSPGAT